MSSSLLLQDVLFVMKFCEMGGKESLPLQFCGVLLPESVGNNTQHPCIVPILLFTPSTLLRST